jgi:LacI family transcriptional regulator
MAVTIYDVARTAGVGVGTVSRVLNNSQTVKKSTRDKVLNAINQLNYSPNPNARSLPSGRTKVIGVIIAFMTRPFSIEVLRSMLNTVTQTDYELVIYNVENDEQRDAYFKNLPMRRRVDGLILVSLSPGEEVMSVFLDSRLPVVLVDAYNPYYTSLVVNNMEGAYLAVKSLIQKGHRRIGFINGIIEGNFKFNQANDRLIGVHRAFSEAGIVFDPHLMIATPWTRVGGRQAAEQLLKLPEPPTAIFAASDIQAVGVLETSRNLKLDVPADLSVIGFDGVELSEILDFSTVQQPMEQMGELAVVKMMELLEQESKSPKLIRLDTKLLERHSTSSPKIKP